MRRLRIAATVVLVATVAACTSTVASPPVTPVKLAWRQVMLPTDPRGRDAVRAVAVCGSRWFAAGGLLAADGSTAPALWTSVDGRTFTAMTIKPVSVYGPDDMLLTVACTGDTVVAVGARSGGAHGNLRTSTWVGSGAGPLTEVAAAFEQYGGESQIGIGSVVAGHPGFLLVGARVDASGGAGAAVWHSPDGTEFTLVDSDPALESGSRGITEVDGAAVGPTSFLAVGGITPPHSPLAARDPIAWRSSDGLHWTRIDFPSSTPDNLLQQVTLLPDGSALAVGADGTRFAAWRSDPSWTRWQRVSVFGSTSTGGASLPGVASLVTVPSANPPGMGSSAGTGSSSGTGGTDVTAYAVVSDGTTYRLYSQAHAASTLPSGNGTGPGPWVDVALPVTVSATPVATGPRIVAVARTNQGLFLGVDDGVRASLWVADLS